MQAAHIGPQKLRHCSLPSPVTTWNHTLCSMRARRQRVVVQAAEFEPMMPSAATLASSAVVLASSIITGAYWWMVVVPSERAALAKSKRRGEVKEYIEELETDANRKAERWFYTNWREQAAARKSLNAWGTKGAGTSSTSTNQASASETAATKTDQASSEGSSPAADNLQSPPNPNLMRPSYVTPMPSFLSFDNPVVVVFATLGAMAAISSAIRTLGL